MSHQFDSKSKMAPRSGLILLHCMIVGMFCLFTIRYWYLQVHKGESYAAQAQENRIRLTPIVSPRGMIRDRNGVPLAINEPSFALALIREDCPDIKKTLEQVSEWSGMDLAALRESFNRGRKRTKSFESQILITDLKYEALSTIEAHLPFWPGLEIIVQHKRYYPEGSVMSHVLGYVAEANEEDLERDKGLALGDSVGKQGLEYTKEAYLRGQKGLKELEVDAFGREHYEKILAEPVQGNGLTLSIDLGLQKKAFELMEGQAGAVVVMEPQTGEVLALVSQPSFDNNLFVLGIPSSKWKELRDNPRHPMQNRVTQSVYPPGSVFKLFMVAAGFVEGVLKPVDSASCRGGYSMGTRVFHCWNRRGHGYMNLRSALTNSCDVFFYVLGERMGIDRIHRQAVKFGFSVPTGIDLPHERSGLIPSQEWKRKRRGEGWTRGETLNASIGQGYVLTSPLQIARFICALCNGGQVLKPMLIKDEGPVVINDMPLADKDRQFILQTMVDTVTSGTARKLHRSDARIGGKTGTAQVVSLSTAGRGKGIPYKYRDHAWMGSFMQKDGKSFVIVNMVEHGGGGSVAAGPIVRAIIDYILSPQSGFFPSKSEDNFQDQKTIRTSTKDSDRKSNG